MMSWGSASGLKSATLAIRHLRRLHDQVAAAADNRHLDNRLRWQLNRKDFNMTQMTYRERRLRKAERLREWADRRDAKADAAYRESGQLVEHIPFGQPILVGHHSEGRHRRTLERSRRKMDQTIEHRDKAEEMRRKADNIEAAAERAIYSDDPDAGERLRETIRGAEVKRDEIKLFNKRCKNDSASVNDLSPELREAWETTQRYTPYQLGKKGEFPSYLLSNLSSNIRRQKQRLARLEG